MAKKQTRRSISVSRMTYERLKAFCETNGISMSQFVENRVGDFLGEGAAIPETPSLGGQVAVERPERPALPPRPAPTPPAPRPPIGGSMPSVPPKTSTAPAASPSPVAPRPSTPTAPVPMTSAAARYAVEPPPPIIKKAEQPAPKAPAMPKANEIFTF